MDATTIALVAIIVSAVSEILPFTPLKGNGIVELVMKALQHVFPKRSDTDT